MAHLHSVYDTDNHFRIDPITKAIKNESNSKVKLMQGDHNSERLTFEIPRYVEGHDMSLCDKVIMHFDNIDSQTKKESKHYFISKDVQISPEDEEIVIFSYLIEKTATKYGGSLNFLIEFVCADSDETAGYAWNTDIYSGISVGKGIHNTEIDVEENKDLLEQFKKEVLAEVDKRIAEAGSSVTIDSELSTESTNPVQNKVVAEKFNELSEEINYLKENGTGSTDGVGQVENAEKNEVPALYLNYSKIYFDEVGKTKTIKATVYGITGNVQWTSDDTNIATVNGGTVTCVGEGSCKITATCGTLTASCDVGFATASGDSEKTEEVFNPEWEIGTLMESGITNDLNTRIRTKEKIRLTKGSTISVATGYKYFIMPYDGPLTTLQGTSGMRTEPFTFNFACECKIVLGRTDDAQMQVGESSNITITKVIDPSEALNDVLVLSGSVGTDGQEVNLTTRIVTDLISLSSKAYLKNPSTLATVCFFDKNGTFSNADSEYSYNENREIPSGSNIRIIFKPSTDSAINIATANSMLANVSLEKNGAMSDISVIIPEAEYEYSLIPINSSWENGSISGSGDEIESTTRIRTTEVESVLSGSKLFIEDGYKILLLFYGDGFSYAEWLTGTYVFEEDKQIRIVLAKTDDTTIATDESLNVGFTKRVLKKGSASDDSANMYVLSVESVGKIGNTLTDSDGADYSLCSIKHNYVDGKPMIPVGYLFHSSYLGMGNTKLYYSPNKFTEPEEIATLDFNANGYVVAISPKHGDIIFCHNDLRRNPIVYNPATKEQTTISGLSENPIGWLQNCGCDFGVDSEGNEYFMFGEYTGVGSSEIDHVNVWKVTYPYTEATNWKIVKTIERTSSYTASEDGKVWHVHTCQRDPYTNIWYVTTGDEDLSCTWWYSTDYGTTWTKFHDGTVWDSQVARVLNFVFTEDAIYWANDYGTNHCLSKIVRNSNNIMDISTYEKLAELNKNQSTYATCYLENPKGILMCDRVDTAFAPLTNKLHIQFYSFDDETVHELRTFKRMENYNSYFGLRCKCYTLRQSPYDKRIGMGFDSSAHNWIDMFGNEEEGMTTLLFEIS